MSRIKLDKCTKNVWTHPVDGYFISADDLATVIEALSWAHGKALGEDSKECAKLYSDAISLLCEDGE
jgi:hypothetical protein